MEGGVGGNNHTRQNRGRSVTRTCVQMQDPQGSKLQVHVFRVAKVLVRGKDGVLEHHGWSAK